jgi:hypothetical protein
MDLAAFSTSFILRNALQMRALEQDHDTEDHEDSTTTSATDARINGTSNANDMTSKSTNYTSTNAIRELLSYYASSAHDERTSTYALVGMDRGNIDSSFRGEGEKNLIHLLDELFKQRLKKKRRKQYYSTIISHGCGQFVKPDTTTTCPVGNQFSTDGQHWCMDNIGSRIDGVLACLLECSLISPSRMTRNDKLHGTTTVSSAAAAADDDDDDNQFTVEGTLSLEKCERKCNSMFMNLHPIPSLISS